MSSGQGLSIVAYFCRQVYLTLFKHCLGHVCDDLAIHLGMLADLVPV